ncbi:MAG: MnhB domain-containing protein [Candidatus Omnitrophota bacterium]
MIGRQEKGMSLIVKTVTKLTAGFVLLYGIYVALNGHRAPGGGFAGGVIAALAFILIMLAFGKEVALRRLRSQTLRVLIGIGALAFLVIVIADFSTRAVFNNEIMIPICEMAVVGLGLFAIFTALVLLSKTDKDAE